MENHAQQVNILASAWLAFIRETHMYSSEAMHGGLPFSRNGSKTGYGFTPCPVFWVDHYGGKMYAA